MSDEAMNLLVGLGLEFRTTKKLYDDAEKKLKRLKVAIRAETRALADAKDDRMVLDQSTYYIPLGDDGSQLKVTRTDDYPTPPVDPQKLLDLVGPEAFFRFVHLETMPTNAFDANEWTRAVTNEEYTHQMLQDSLGEAPAPKAWSVGVK